MSGCASADKTAMYTDWDELVGSSRPDERVLVDCCMDCTDVVGHKQVIDLHTGERMPL